MKVIFEGKKVTLMFYKIRMFSFAEQFHDGRIYSSSLSLIEIEIIIIRVDS